MFETDMVVLKGEMFFINAIYLPYCFQRNMFETSIDNKNYWTSGREIEERTRCPTEGTMATRRFRRRA